MSCHTLDTYTACLPQGCGDSVCALSMSFASQSIDRTLYTGKASPSCGSACESLEGTRGQTVFGSTGTGISWQAPGLHNNEICTLPDRELDYLMATPMACQCLLCGTFFATMLADT